MIWSRLVLDKRCSVISRDGEGPMGLVCGFGLVAALLFPGIASGQSQRLVRDFPQQCSVAFNEVGVLGGDGESVLGAIATSEGLPDGRIAVVFSETDNEFTVFSSSGSFQSVGRQGEGPGEYKWVRWIKSRGGKLHVIDPFQGRVTVLDDQSFEILRESRYPAGHYVLGGAEVVHDSLYVVNALLFTSERAGYALHAFGADGELRHSFDEVSEAYAPYTSETEMGVIRQLLHSNLDNGLWAANRNRYQLDLWDVTTGHRMDRLVREVDWFPSHGRELPVIPGEPPPPTILDLQQDGRGRLWVMIRVPSNQWAEHVIPRPGDAHPEFDAYVLRDGGLGAFDTLVEVIDVSSARVVASARLDGISLLAFVGSPERAITWGKMRGTEIPVLPLWELGFADSDACTFPAEARSRQGHL